MGDYDNARINLDSGITLSYREQGSTSSRPPLLLLHGLNAHSGTWRRNFDALSKDLRTLAPTLPAWRGPIRDLDILHYVDYVRELVSKLGVEKISAIGNSMGGWIGMSLVSRYPNLIEKLVLEDSAGISDPKDEETIQSIVELGIPVLILWGKEDRIIPVSAARHLHSRIPKSKLVVFDGVGHVPHWEVPDKFNEIVLGFLTL